MPPLAELDATTIALIAAGIGLIGAILGAAASTVGTVWVKRREATRERRVQLYEHHLPDVGATARRAIGQVDDGRVLKSITWPTLNKVIDSSRLLSAAENAHCDRLIDAHGRLVVVVVDAGLALEPYEDSIDGLTPDAHDRFYRSQRDALERVARVAHEYQLHLRSILMGEAGRLGRLRRLWRARQIQRASRRLERGGSRRASRR